MHEKKNLLDLDWKTLELSHWKILLNNSYSIYYLIQ